METRKIQKTGGSTYIISLPKQWADKVGIKSGMRVGVQPQPDGNLLISLNTGSRPPKKKVIDVTDLTGHPLEREIIAAYLSGYSIIEFSSRRILADQKKVIRSVCYKLIGTEIIEENSQSVVIQDLLNPSDMSIKKGIQRMFIIAGSMFRDSVKALQTLDLDLATDVEQRDDEVDRLFLVIAKQFRLVLCGSNFADRSGTSIEEYHDLRMAAAPIERIADHAQKIARVIIAKEPKYDEKTLKKVEEMGKRAESIASAAIDALFSSDSSLANQAIEEHAALVRKIAEFNSSHFNHSVLLSDPVSLQMIVDSIGRVADYGVNIAEIAINASIDNE